MALELGPGDAPLKGSWEVACYAGVTGFHSTSGAVLQKTDLLTTTDLMPHPGQP